MLSGGHMMITEKGSTELHPPGLFPTYFILMHCRRDLKTHFQSNIFLILKQYKPEIPQNKPRKRQIYKQMKHFNISGTIT